MKAKNKARIFYYLASKNIDKNLSSRLSACVAETYYAKKILRDERGKPYFEGGEYFLSISHSARLFIMAVACEEIGVDTEKIRAVARKEVISEKYFHRTIASDSDFLGLWTEKEAIVKRSGEGIAAIADAECPREEVHDISSGIPEGYLASLVCRGIDEIEYIEIIL